MAEARDSFGQALARLRSEDGFRRWLEAQRRFHRYSLHNILWILYQSPNATHVESYKRWRDELGYQVRRGEVGLMVWVPTLVKPKPADPKSGEQDEDVEKRRILRFRIGKVFDRAQVDPIPGEAKPLNPPPVAPVDGDSHEWAIPLLERFARSLGYTVEYLALPPEQGGFHTKQEGVIGVNETRSPNGKVKVLAHELAHAHGIDYKTFGRRRAEAIVDCAAYIVCSRIGLDVTATSVPYVAGWAKDDMAVIERDAKEIDRVAGAILRGSELEDETHREKRALVAAR
jgi:antirestriction protein ArdC